MSSDFDLLTFFSVFFSYLEGASGSTSRLMLTTNEIGSQIKSHRRCPFWFWLCIFFRTLASWFCWSVIRNLVIVRKPSLLNILARINPFVGWGYIRTTLSTRPFRNTTTHLICSLCIVCFSQSCWGEHFLCSFKQFNFLNVDSIVRIWRHHSKFTKSNINFCPRGLLLNT